MWVCPDRHTFFSAGVQAFSLRLVAVEFPASEETFGFSVEQKGRQAVDGKHYDEGLVVVGVLGHKAANQHAEPDAEVPCRQKGRVGRAPLVVVGHTYHHVLKGGPEVSVAKSDKQSRSVVTGRVLAEDKQPVTQRRQQQAEAAVVGNQALLQGAVPQQA